MAAGILSVTLFVIVCIAHIATVVSFDRLSDLQIAVHPKYLYTCGDKGMTLGRMTKQQEDQQIISLLDCLGNSGIKKVAPKMNQEKVNKFNEVIRQMKTGHWRLKRQVSNIGQPRREVRMLSPAEWEILTSRFNWLRDGGFYKEIVDFFSDESIAGTNGGPAFLGWHRVVLLWVEYYLRVPLPYWDCTLDFHITDPTKSILWTKDLFGNGEGAVITGPFMNFTESDGTPISRNIGHAGSLMARENLDSLLARKSNRELVYTTNIALEEYHNGIQAWVGGSMAGVLTAPSDPVYFFHQCFIDKLWHDIRQNMPDPSDYPYDPTVTSPMQRPNKVMARLPFDSRFPLINSDGYTDVVSSRAHFSSSPAQSVQPWQCHNPTWKNKSVLMWDTDRKICVTGQGTHADFNFFPGMHTSLGNSAMNFPLMSTMGSMRAKTPKIKYVAPLKDIRTIHRTGKSMKNTKITSQLSNLLSMRMMPSSVSNRYNKRPAHFNRMRNRQSKSFGINSRNVQTKPKLQDRRFNSPNVPTSADLSELVLSAFFPDNTINQRSARRPASRPSNAFTPRVNNLRDSITTLESLLRQLRTLPH